MSVLAAGDTIGDGRYRLVAQVGEDGPVLRFWRAHDELLERDVALTVVLGDPDAPSAVQRARRILGQVRRVTDLAEPLLTAVLDILDLDGGLNRTDGALGVVVSGWPTGSAVEDLVAERPLEPSVAAALLGPLATAVQRAHEQGMVLGIGRPQRMHIGGDGLLRLAFPGASPGKTLRDDVRGLGALLYLLLTGRRPLPGGATAPHTLVPGLPTELSNLALRCLSDREDLVDDVRTAAAMVTVLERFSGPRWHPIPVLDQPMWTTPAPPRHHRLRRRVALSAGVFAMAGIAMLVWLVGGVIGSVTNDNANGPLPAKLHGPPTRSPAGPPAARPSPVPRVAAPITPATTAPPTTATTHRHTSIAPRTTTVRPHRVHRPVTTPPTHRQTARPPTSSPPASLPPSSSPASSSPPSSSPPSSSPPSSSTHTSPTTNSQTDTATTAPSTGRSTTETPTGDSTGSTAQGGSPG